MCAHVRAGYGDHIVFIARHLLVVFCSSGGGLTELLGCILATLRGIARQGKARAAIITKDRLATEKHDD